MFLRFLNNNNEFIIDGQVEDDVELGESVSGIPYAEFGVVSNNSHIKYEEGEPVVVTGEPVFHVVRVFGDLIHYAEGLKDGDIVRVHGHFRNLFVKGDNDEDVEKTVVSWHKILYGDMLKRIKDNEESLITSLSSLNNNPLVSNFLKNRDISRK